MVKGIGRKKALLLRAKTWKTEKCSVQIYGKIRNGSSGGSGESSGITL